jgi:hypothetical protein
MQYDPSEAVQQRIVAARETDLQDLRRAYRMI